MRDHEYALLGGQNRATIGRWVASLSALISGGLVFLLLSAVDLANQFGLDVNLPPSILSLVGAGMIYAVLYRVFDKHVWKWSYVAKLLKVPNLAGKWDCEGTPLSNGKASVWRGTMTIVQSWDKIYVHVATENSTSHSVAAALVFDTVEGYRLLYHYRNEPRLALNDMAPHHGFAELLFEAGEQAGSGEYFNGRGRNSFGTMKVARC